MRDFRDVLLRLVEKVERANTLQHSRPDHRIPAEDWAELFQLTNEARGVLARDAADAEEIRAALAERFPDDDLETLFNPDSVAIVERYTSDGPGYSGPVAFYVWGGDPGTHNVLLQRAGIWKVYQDVDVDAAGLVGEEAE